MPSGVPRQIRVFSDVFSDLQILLLHDGLFVVVGKARFKARLTRCLSGIGEELDGGF